MGEAGYYSTSSMKYRKRTIARIDGIDDKT